MATKRSKRQPAWCSPGLLRRTPLQQPSLTRGAPRRPPGVNLKYRAFATPLVVPYGLSASSLSFVAQVIAQLTAEWALLSGLGFGRSDLSKSCTACTSLHGTSTRPRISQHWRSRIQDSVDIYLWDYSYAVTGTIHTLHQQGYC